MGAECGVVKVPENYETPAGRSIALHVVILRSANPNAGNAPLFELEGGPGVAVTANVSFYATDGAVYHQNRDVVFVDMRGTGRSNPLICAALDTYEQAEPSGSIYPTSQTAACAADLSHRADLSQYTTANAVRDLDAVRQALRAEQIALDALSYGTTLALAYMAEHPDRVSAAVLTSTVPADRTPPRFHAIAAQAALTQIFDACATDAACDAHFPNPTSDLERARGRFSTAEETEVFTERLRTMMYAPAGARRVPLFLHQSARGGAPAQSYSTPAVADGLYLSVTCAESFPHFDLEMARAEARSTVFGDYRLRRQSAACAVWPTSPSTPPTPKHPIQIPVLFVSGSFDPVSPPEWTNEVLEYFPNGRHVVIEGGGHIVDGLSNLDTCYDPLIVRFLDARNALDLDTSCLSDVRPPAFAVQ
jgi:pimeloyl-ACP methyl ester carboxylesterase